MALPGCAVAVRADRRVVRPSATAGAAGGAVAVPAVVVALALAVAAACTYIHT